MPPKYTHSRREKISKTMRAAWRSPKGRKKLLQGRKKYRKDHPIKDSTKNKISISLKKYYKTPNAIETHRQALINHYKDNPKARKLMSRIRKRQYKEDPEYKKKIDRTVTQWWKEHPNLRKVWSDRIKKFFKDNPEAFENFLKNGKNAAALNIKTKQGFIVRSKGEQQIANFLHENNIPCLYESFSLPITTKPYAGNICTPDFYLPSLNIFIEFYGGYPSAWKKKVLKNKLYKAHKIPVLGITPAELENLNYYLLKDGKKLSESKVAREFKIKDWIK